MNMFTTRMMDVQHINELLTQSPSIKPEPVDATNIIVTKLVDTLDVVKDDVKHREGRKRKKSDLAPVAPTLCAQCGRSFSSNFNLRRHMSSCKLCPESKRGPRFVCQCGRTYCQEWDMKKHQARCKEPKKKCKPCLVEHCNLLFYHKTQLISHLKRDHSMKIQDPEVFHFECFEEFLKWKEREEEDTYTYYSKQTGSNVTGVSVNTYYVCQHDGSERAHNKEPRKTARKNKKGRIKTGRLCWSQMNVKQFKDGSVKVTYYPSHTHPLSIADTKHHPLPHSVTMEIKRRLSEELIDDPLAANMEDIKNSRKKKYGLTLRALKSLARKNRNLFRITNEAVAAGSKGYVEQDTEQKTPDEDEDEDDPQEVKFEEDEMTEEQKLALTSVECVEEMNRVRLLLESRKLKVEQVTELTELLRNFVEKQVKRETDKDEDFNVLYSTMLENTIEQTEVNETNNTNTNTVYQILSMDAKEREKEEEFLYQGAVELVSGTREFIIISAEHGQYFNNLDSNVQFEFSSCDS